MLGKFIFDDEDRFAIDAEVIELGGSESFVSLTGVASSDYDAQAGTILVDLDPGQGDGLDSTIVVEVAEETKSFSADGEPVEPESIVVGTRLEVDGVLELSSDSPDLIRAAVIFVSEIVTPAEI